MPPWSTRIPEKLRRGGPHNNASNEEHNIEYITIAGIITEPGKIGLRDLSTRLQLSLLAATIPIPTKHRPLHGHTKMLHKGSSRHHLRYTRPTNEPATIIAKTPRWPPATRSRLQIGCRRCSKLAAGLRDHPPQRQSIDCSQPTFNVLAIYLDEESFFFERDLVLSFSHVLIWFISMQLN